MASFPVDQQPGSPEDEELLSRRMLTQILGVVVASSMFVLALYLVGIVGNARDDGETATTDAVAQMPPTVPPDGASSSDTGSSDDTGSSSDIGSSDDTGSSSTTAADTGTAPTSSGAADTRPSTPGATTGSPTATPRIADVSASDVRADSTDSCGAPTSYQPIFAVDSVRETAWMAPGDGRGAVLTIELTEPSIVSEVGLVAGYDKVDPCTGTDRFDEMRRVTAVRWTFDGDASIDQELSPTRAQQTTSLGLPIVASRITMTILSTTEPGIERLDQTPVSEVFVL